MDAKEALAILTSYDGAEEPAVLPKSVLADIRVSDVPENVYIQIGTLKDQTIHLDWSGQLFVRDGKLVGEADYTWTRKYLSLIHI